MHMPSQQHIGENGHSGEKLDVLVGSSDAGFGKVMGGEVGDILPIKENLSFLGLVITGNTIEQTGFAGAVWSDDGNQFSRIHFEINLVEGRDAPESQSEVIHLQLGPFFIGPSRGKDTRFAAKGFHLMILIFSFPGAQKLVAGV